MNENVIISLILSVTSLATVCVYALTRPRPVPSYNLISDRKSTIVDHSPSIYKNVIHPPEYRDPPIRKYKPHKPHQMGLLKSEDGEVLPLWGKEARTHRDRFHYWTTSGDGHAMYSTPIKVDDRECEDDIGCKEIYGGEAVSVFGKDKVYVPRLYRTDDFF